MILLKQLFIETAGHYSADKQVIQQLWNEINDQYCSQERHYHTLNHLEGIVNELKLQEETIEDWDTVMFSVFYHDIIYNVLKSDNEELSADLATKRLAQLGVPPAKIERTHGQVLMTKTHAFSEDGDANILVDADLSILGKPLPVYLDYCQKIRKEYFVYPDIVYKPGRRKVLENFLQREKIYMTPYFFAAYEKQARNNLQHELSVL